MLRSQIFEKHRDFLDQYSTDGLREIQAVADFILELSYCVRREAAPIQHEIISLGEFSFSAQFLCPRQGIHGLTPTRPLITFTQKTFTTSSSPVDPSRPWNATKRAALIP